MGGPKSGAGQMVWAKSGHCLRTDLTPNGRRLGNGNVCTIRFKHAHRPVFLQRITATVEVENIKFVNHQHLPPPKWRRSICQPSTVAPSMLPIKRTVTDIVQSPAGWTDTFAPLYLATANTVDGKKINPEIRGCTPLVVGN